MTSMPAKTLNLEQLKTAIISAANNLINHRQRIDALNVFPVPDGDTGTNMSSTLEKASLNLQKSDHDSIGVLMNQVSRDMLLGARGNSGVILSQIFKGFSNAWKSANQTLTNQNVIAGFHEAAKTAYSSVLKPIEGTILTVIREVAETIQSQVRKEMDIITIFQLAYEAGQKSLANTPNILPVLKEVGVVDSGGDGLVIILEGFVKALEGQPITVNQATAQQLQFISDTEIYTGEFGYCSEVIVQLKKPEAFKRPGFVGQIEKLGNSLVAVQDQEILKVHIHTISPGKILNFCQKYGEFLAVKIENMTEQANHTKAQAAGGNQILSLGPGEKGTQKNLAIISCNSGNGFIALMNEYECDYVIDCGQTNNPSAQDFLDAIELVNSDSVIILPNNANFILAAQQAAKMVKQKNIHIVPTKTQVEGVTSILNYSSDLSIKDNLHEINASLSNLVVGQITQAVKSTKIGGVKIEQNDYLMIKDNKIIATKHDVIKAACSLVDEMMKGKKQAEILVIYYGNNLSSIDAGEVEKYVLKKHPVEVEIVASNQPVYDFLFGLE